MIISIFFSLNWYFTVFCWNKNSVSSILLRVATYTSQLQCRVLALLDEISRQSARHNGTSRRLDGAACPSFVPDIRECHPLLRPPFGIGQLSGGKGQRMASNGPFDWTTTSRPLPTRRPTLECENLFQNIPWGGSWTFSILWIHRATPVDDRNISFLLLLDTRDFAFKLFFTRSENRTYVVGVPKNFFADMCIKRRRLVWRYA